MTSEPNQMETNAVWPLFILRIKGSFGGEEKTLAKFEFVKCSSHDPADTYVSDDLFTSANYVVDSGAMFGIQLAATSLPETFEEMRNPYLKLHFPENSSSYKTPFFIDGDHLREFDVPIIIPCQSQLPNTASTTPDIIWETTVNPVSVYSLLGDIRKSRYMWWYFFNEQKVENTNWNLTEISIRYTDADNKERVIRIKHDPEIIIGGYIWGWLPIILRSPILPV